MYQQRVRRSVAKVFAGLFDTSSELDGGNMSNLHYQLIPCEKCSGELYGPIRVELELAVPLEAQIESIETAVSSSHPHHEVNGFPLKRYSDFEFPQY